MHQILYSLLEQYDFNTMLVPQSRARSAMWNKMIDRPSLLEIPRLISFFPASYQLIEDLNCRFDLHACLVAMKNLEEIKLKFQDVSTAIIFRGMRPAEKVKKLSIKFLSPTGHMYPIMIQV